MRLAKMLRIERWLMFVSVVALTLFLQLRATVPKEDAVAMFAKAMNITVNSVENGFDLINASAIRLDEEKNIYTYLKEGKPRLSPHWGPVFTTEDLSQRFVILRGLSQYVKVLTAISNTDARERIQNGSSHIAGSLISINANLSAFNMNTIPLPEREQMASALNALGQVLIDHKIEKELPSIVEKMHPQIVEAVLFIKTDIGDIKRNSEPTESGVCGKDRNGCGLRRMLQLYIESRQIFSENILMFYRMAGNNSLDNLQT